MKWQFKWRFWMTRLIFLGVCAYIVASTVNVWVGYRLEKSFPPVATESVKKTVSDQGETFSKRDFNALNERNIFGARREKVIVELEEEIMIGSWEDAVATGLGARLIATMVFPFPEYSLATIEVSGNTGVYSINECTSPAQDFDPLFSEIMGPAASSPLAPCNRLMGVASIKRIEERRIVFFNERDHRYEYLAMETGYTPPPAPSRHVMMPKQPEAGDGSQLASTLRQTGANSYEIDAKDFDATIGNMAAIAAQARIVPAFEDGRSVGFKLFNIAPNSIYSKIGMQDGDIITQINGYELNSPDKALQLYQMRSTVSQLNIDIKRGGSSVSTEVRIAGRPQ